MMLVTSCSSIPNNLQRFKEANGELTSPKPNEDRVVFMGNSITEGWGNLRPEFFAGKPYVNRGISGETTPQMLTRFKQDVVRLEPAVVVILAGINDIAGNTGPTTIEAIVENIVSMIEMANKNDIKVVLCAVLPANKFPWQPSLKPAEKVVELNILLKDYATTNELEYVDFYAPMVDDDAGLQLALGEDGVHPNVDGYLIMEPLLEAALARALARQ
ncbi:MAG: SGNH/GDSL hydrolase family protein [Lewinella sp.]